MLAYRACNTTDLLSPFGSTPPSKPHTTHRHEPRPRRARSANTSSPPPSQYITKTFTLAAPNLSINGLELSDDLSILSPDYDDAAAAARRAAEPEVVFAPFDARARARVEDLTREEEDLLRDIAALKKSVPGAAATAWAESARASVRADEEALAAAVERARSGANNNNTDGSPAAESAAAAAAAADAALQLDVARLERQDEVEASYGRAIDGLARLKREMPAVVARMERARAAGSYVVTEK